MNKEELNNLSDGELIHLANQMGMEDLICPDVKGGLTNREETIKEINGIEGGY